MAHIITAKQIAGQHTKLLASSNEDHKRLYAIVTITLHKYHVSEQLTFVVTVDDVIVNISTQASSAMKAYNKVHAKAINVKVTENILTLHGGRYIPVTSICPGCAKQDHCNAWLRQPERLTTKCASFETLK